jgi:hypothetical protein
MYSRHRLIGQVHVDDGGDLLHEGAVHGLGLQQLVLSLDQLGDVEHQSQPEERLVFSPADEEAVLTDPDGAAVPMKGSVFDPEALAALDRVIAGGDDALAVIGVDDLLPAQVGREPFVPGDPQHGLDGRADVDHRLTLVHAIEVDLFQDAVGSGRLRRRGSEESIPGDRGVAVSAVDGVWTQG